MAGVVGSGGSLAAVGVEVLAVQVGDAEGQVQGLAAVEAGIACRLVAVAQVALGDVVAAAGALGDVVAGEFDVDAAGMSAEYAVHLEESGDFVEHVVEVPGLVAAGRFHRVAVHRSHTQATGGRLAAIFSTSGGSAWRIRRAPIRVVRVSRPGSWSGSRASISSSTSCAVASGPILTAMGLRIWRANSTWAPRGSRVRSPIHSR